MDTITKEIMNEHGFEDWTNQEPDTNYKVSQEKLNKTHQALVRTRKDNLARDIAAYEQMRARLPPGPPGRINNVR